jgi:hypothetical protein
VFLTKWGTPGSGDGQFNTTVAVAVDGSGNVYVVDRNNNRVEKFSSSGTFLAKWGSFGSGDGQFNGPWGVAVDSSGNVYVTDGGNNRVQKFSSSGTFLTKWGTPGSGDGQFNGPFGVAVDGSGNVYIVDNGNNFIQKFALSIPSALSVSVAPTGPLSMDAGQTQLFTAAASGGTGALFYQWYLDSAVVSGQTSSTYSYTGVLGSHSVYVRVTDSASPPVSVNSNTVSVTVSSALSVSVAPVGPLVLSVGQSQTFTATVSGGTGTKSYQWYLDSAVVSGQTSSTYTYTYPTALGSHTIYVKVTDSATTPATVQSSAVSIGLKPILSVSISPISSVTLYLGQTQSFIASASGGSNSYSRYQWYSNGSPLSGQTSSTLNYTPSEISSYTITVTVTDSLGETSPQSSATTLNVIKEPTPTPSPLVAPTLSVTQKTVNQGDHIYVASTYGTSGVAPYSYQWYQKGPGDSAYTAISYEISYNLDYLTSGSLVAGTWYFKLQVIDSTNAKVETSPIAVELKEFVTTTHLSGYAEGEHSILLSWDQINDINFAKYDVYMSKSSSELGKIKTITSRSDCRYEATNLDPDTTYYFKIRTTSNSSIYSDSNTIGVKTNPSFPWTLVLSIIGVIALILAAASPKIISNYKRKKAKTLKEKGDEFLKKKQRLEAAESFGRACILNIQLKAPAASIKSNLEKYYSNARAVVLQTVLGSKKSPLPDRLKYIQSELAKCVSVKKYKGRLDVDGIGKITEIDLLISQANDGNLESIVDEALKESEIKEKLIMKMLNTTQISLTDLADKLDLSEAAIYSLLSKTLQQKLINGYITRDKKTYMSNRYVSETLTGLFKNE